MKLAIIGSRNIFDIDISSHIDKIPTVVISGGAKGIDTLARQYALKNNIRLIEYLPDYKEYGRQAPIIRNIKIVENCDSVLAFWDGKSRGTKFTIDYARKKNKPFKIIRI